jgi:hypothetical protein
MNTFRVTVRRVLVQSYLMREDGHREAISLYDIKGDGNTAFISVKPLNMARSPSMPSLQNRNIRKRKKLSKTIQKNLSAGQTYFPKRISY